MARTCGRCLGDRKAKLEKLLGGSAAGIVFNEHTDQDGAPSSSTPAGSASRAKCERLTAPYRSGRRVIDQGQEPGQARRLRRHRSGNVGEERMNINTGKPWSDMGPRRTWRTLSRSHPIEKSGRFPVRDVDEVREKVGGPSQSVPDGYV